jgi:mismatch-specific thymine-DNA glycosylase
MYLSELTPTQMTAEEDYRLIERGIGFTNIVSRPTKGSADLTRKEIKDGCTTLLEKLQKFQPKVAVFNGKLIYEVFSGKKDFYFGKQAELVEGTNTVSSLILIQCVKLTHQLLSLAAYLGDAIQQRSLRSTAPCSRQSAILCCIEKV